MEIERRALAPFEIRQDEDIARVVGHAAVFNQEARIGGFFREIILPGAFTRAIQEDDVPFLIEHDDLPLARNRSGTLRLSEDDIGLRIETDLDVTDPDVQRILPKMRRGDLNKMSFGFRVRPGGDEWREDNDELDLRVLKQLELFDVSIVTTPAYQGTDIALRSRDAAFAEVKAMREEEEKRKAFERRKMLSRLSRISDLKQRESALESAKRSLR